MSEEQSDQHPIDLTRRRVIAGIGLLGMGAFGGGLYRALADEVIASPPGGSGPGTTPSPTTLQPGPSSTVRPPSTTAPLLSSTTAASATTSLPPETIVACREAWGAQPPGSGMVEHLPVRLTLHHTAVSQTSPAEGPARARRHQQYHQSLGWADLAYHFLVDRTGMAYAGRDVRFRGDTGTEYDPTGHFLVCMEGDFDVQEPAPAQLDATVGLFAWAANRFGIDPETLAGHGAYADTSCPGASVVPLIPQLASAIATLGGASLDLRCGSEGAELVAAVESLDR
ncbi:MAG TPA: peptidoglycan recognition family protein [Acidimicrobiia bacterium]